MCCEFISLVGVLSVFGLDGEDLFQKSSSGMDGGGYWLLVTLVGLVSVCDMMSVECIVVI